MDIVLETVGYAVRRAHDTKVNQLISRLGHVAPDTAANRAILNTEAFGGIIAIVEPR